MVIDTKLWQKAANSMSRNLNTGGEIISYCTKCRMELNHRIIAMVDGVPIKVECSTCYSHHRYRPAKEDRQSPKGASSRSEGAPRASKSVSAQAAAKLAADAQRLHSWESRIGGKMVEDFSRYSPRESYTENQLLRHAKFGDGYVSQVLDANKVEVVFQDGPRTLAQNLK